MSALLEALHTSLSSDDHLGQQVYKGKVHELWAVGAIPFGGYTLGLVLAAAAASQVHTTQPDVIHVTAHFMRTATVGDYEVRVRRVREGKWLSNVDADLIQNGVTKITARLIFGVLPDMTKSSTDPLTLQPPSPLARRIPLITHPSRAKLSPMDPKFRVNLNAAGEPVFRARNAAKAEPRIDEDPDSGVLEFGAWFELPGADERITGAMIPIFADLLRNLPELLPAAMRPGPSWYPTIVMSIEFKAKLPYPPPSASQQPYSPRTIGLYSTGRFLAGGRHDAYGEVWTAPSAIGQATTSADADAGWRGEQICLAVSHQMALTIPLEVNLKRAATRKDEGSRL